MEIKKKLAPLTESTLNTIISSKRYARISPLQENNLRKLIQNNVKFINESTTSGDIAQFIPVLIPMVRRTYSSIVIPELLGVQTLKAPSEYIYALTYRYTGNSTSATSSISPNAQGQILTATTPFTNVSVGATVEDSNNNTGVVIYFAPEANPTALLIKYDTQPLGTGTLQGSGVAGTVAAVYNNEAGFKKVLENYGGSYETAVAESLSTNMNELGVSIERTVAESKERALKGKYTVEALQDLKAMHGLDLQSEVEKMLSAELALEIDREGINFINANATQLPTIAIGASTGGRWDIEKYRLLALKLTDEAREIGRYIRKGSANKLLISPKVASALDALGGNGQFISASLEGSRVDALKAGASPVLGKFDGRFDVVVDNFATGEYATVIYKDGSSNIDAGAFFCPYIGAFLIEVRDPNSGQPALIVKSRYTYVQNPLNADNYFRTFGVDFTSSILSL